MTKSVALMCAMALLLTLGSCRSGGDDAGGGPSYTPIPDADLYDQIGQLDGVVSVDISYQDSFSGGSTYNGQVEVDPGVDASALLAQAYATLRQGRFQAAINVVAVQDNRQVSASSFGLDSPIDIDLTQVFGPQPGDGTPPSTD